MKMVDFNSSVYGFLFLDEPNRKKQDSIETDEEDAELEKELNEELKSFEVG
jgi:hypothetical protein